MLDGSDRTVTLALDGEVTLGDFATAVMSFRELVDALGSEVQLERGRVRWVIDDLSAGSALATAVAVSDDDPEALSAAGAVVEGFLQVGRSLRNGASFPYGRRVEDPARAIARLLPRIQRVRFETATDEAVITAAPSAQTAFGREGSRLRRALGAVRGRVQTLSSRGQLRFTLYDSVTNRAVSCYLAEGGQDLMRNAWDRAAQVTGMVTRDESGRALSVRQVRDVRLLAEAGPHDYLAARGAVSVEPGAPKPEELIRRLRDAG